MHPLVARRLIRAVCAPASNLFFASKTKVPFADGSLQHSFRSRPFSRRKTFLTLLLYGALGIFLFFCFPWPSSRVGGYSPTGRRLRATPDDLG